MHVVEWVSLNFYWIPVALSSSSGLPFFPCQTASDVSLWGDSLCILHTFPLPYNCGMLCPWVPTMLTASRKYCLHLNLSDRLNFLFGGNIENVSVTLCELPRNASLCWTRHIALCPLHEFSFPLTPLPLEEFSPSDSSLNSSHALQAARTISLDDCKCGHVNAYSTICVHYTIAFISFKAHIMRVLTSSTSLVDGMLTIGQGGDSHIQLTE